MTIESPDISGTYSINHGRMKGWVDLGATQWFHTATRGLGIQHPNHYAIVAWGNIWVLSKNNSISNWWPKTQHERKSKTHFLVLSNKTEKFLTSFVSFSIDSIPTANKLSRILFSCTQLGVYFSAKKKSIYCDETIIFRG